MCVSVRNGETDVIIECDILEWLASNSENFHVKCNAHRENHTTVARHLLHRERLGEDVRFASEEAMNACIDNNIIWEMSIRQHDGSDVHFAASSFAQCMKLARSLMSRSGPRAIAA